jgi:hypothetical protein
MRARRHDAEYPPADSPEITAADVREDQVAAVGSRPASICDSAALLELSNQDLADLTAAQSAVALGGWRVRIPPSAPL